MVKEPEEIAPLQGLQLWCSRVGHGILAAHACGCGKIGSSVAAADISGSGGGMLTTQSRLVDEVAQLGFSCGQPTIRTSLIACRAGVQRGGETLIATSALLGHAKWDVSTTPQAAVARCEWRVAAKFPSLAGSQ